MKSMKWANVDKLRALKELTEHVVEASRILPGVSLFDMPGGEQFEKSNPVMPVINNTGVTLIRPGGWTCYPSFWIRDFAMSLDCEMFTAEELKGMLLLTAATQNGREPLHLDRVIIPPFAVADHINLDGRPVYYPGTYSTGPDQGGSIWGLLPPYCDAFYFIFIADAYINKTGNQAILHEIVEGVAMLERLERAYRVPEFNIETGIVTTQGERRAVNFGFVDSIVQTGSLLFATLLKYQAAKMLDSLLMSMGLHEQAAVYRKEALLIKREVPVTFGTSSGWLLAATEIGRQPDVWGTAYAVSIGLLEGEAYQLALSAIHEGYLSGTTCYKGNVRHIPTTEDASFISAWSELVAVYPINTYQNGAYWGTPTGWYMDALNRKDPDLAAQMLEEYVDGMLTEDFRNVGKEGAPWECIHPDGEYRQNGVYMTSVTVPYGVLKAMI
jgi:hypothetical protein